MPCLDENRVLQFLEGLLTSEQARAVERHLDSCEDCRWLVSSMGVLEQEPQAPGQEEEQAPTSWPLGQVLGGQYMVERLLGQGPHGEVYEASHLWLPQLFAVKVLTPEQTNNPDTLRALRRDAESAAAIRHPGIVSPVELLELVATGGYALVYPLLDGEDLCSRLHRTGRITNFERLAHILRQLTLALHEAHRRGLIHGDLKPTNIFLNDLLDGKLRVQVLDFGMAPLGRLRATTGDRCYHAPEQLAGEPHDRRADIYGVGALVYEMFSGAPPPPRDHLDPAADALPLRWVPRLLKQAVQRATATRPEQRHQSMQELWESLATALGVPS